MYLKITPAKYAVKDVVQWMWKEKLPDFKGGYILALKDQK